MMNFLRSRQPNDIHHIDGLYKIKKRKEGRKMLIMKELMDSLAEEELEENYKNDNDDYDLGEVLKFCGSDTFPKREMMCTDGQKRVFTFDD